MHDLLDVCRIVGNPREHRHQQYTGGNAGAGQGAQSRKPAGGGGCKGVNLFGDRILCRCNGDMHRHRAKFLNLLQNRNIPHHQVGLCGDDNAKAIPVNFFQGAPCQLLVLFKEIVRVTHRAGMDDPCPPPGAQLPLQYIQRIFLGAHLIKIFDLIAFAAAVAVNAAMAAAPVQIHIVVAAKPILLLTVAGKDGFGRDIFHTLLLYQVIEPRFSRLAVLEFSRDPIHPAVPLKQSAGLHKSEGDSP